MKILVSKAGGGKGSGWVSMWITIKSEKKIRWRKMSGRSWNTVRV